MSKVGGLGVSLMVVVSSVRLACNVPTLGEGAGFKFNFICDLRSILFQLFVFRYQNFGSFAKRVLADAL